ncbi:1-acyl-sn-glycerol-3-phosphate acyltransferase [Natronosporangium hydrolyticum]|uniref:1-acyl-sn-glycerol-3-phosphate acyltransferase n=1 Tax=Natronosporangium hydrolyticum TaxID=2811111 RepID=A0A895YF70_9ACTN|nr:lysophospholipid acyltransferase family protein [Natronosporangium hydrolyticum]QSB14782.1 1-acyl-sn-glycerol-3-phosphate acyltransferase [Natronosporangium hydrolyticum]
MGLIREIRVLTRGRDWRGRSRLPRSANGHQTAEPAREFPTGWARTRTAHAARRAVQRAVLTPLTWTQTKPEVTGVDRLAGLTGPVVLVANHSSHLDAPLILGSLPPHLADRVAVGAAADYFFDARWRAAVTALVFNAFPVERYRSSRLRSLAPYLLARGWSLLLFPEATRSEDGWMSTLRLGAAHLCVSRQVPAVPIALRGTYAAMPRGRNWPTPGRPRVVVRYGTPLFPSEGEETRRFNTRLADSISRLWAEEELGWYESLRAEQRGELSLPTGPPAASWRRIWESSRPLPRTEPPHTWR